MEFIVTGGRKVNGEPWNKEMQEKCTVYTKLAATVEDCIRGKNRGKGDCVQEWSVRADM